MGIVLNPGPDGIIKIELGYNEIVIRANKEGFLELARVFQAFADSGPEVGDVHGDAGIDLHYDSENLIIDYLHHS